MMRCALFVAAVFAASAVPAGAAAPDLAGNWLLTYAPRGANVEQNYVLVKVEMKDGKPTASVLATPFKGAAINLKDFQADDKTISFALTTGPSFAGAIGNDAKQILGSFGTDQSLFRAKLVKTDKETIDAPTTPGTPVPPMTEAQRLLTRPNLLRAQAQREMDAEKKKDLLKQAADAQKEIEEKVPALYREVVAKHADSPAAIDAGLDLLTGADKYKVSAADATKLIDTVEKLTTPYGGRYSRFVQLQMAEGMASQKGIAPAAVAFSEKLVNTLTDKDPAAMQVKVLTARKMALENAGMADMAKMVDARITKLEEKVDAEYLATVPPFKPMAFAGRKDKAANQMAVLELFTGAQCPPCVAADVAFDALLKTYKPTDVVMLQYHMHIPGPDPMTNPDTVARWDYYRAKFPEGIRGVPSSVFNGKPDGGGGGGMANSEAKYKQYMSLINPLLEKSSAAKIGGKAVRTGDKVAITVEADGLEPSDDLKVRLLLVEDTVKHLGSNGIRFHHHVVRGMPGGAAGFAVKDKAFKQTASADVADIRTGLTKYLDDYAANTRPFPQPGRPMDMKNLKVIAIVQNDKTGEIVQAGQIEVEGKAAGGSR